MVSGRRKDQLLNNLMISWGNGASRKITGKFNLALQETQAWSFIKPAGVNPWLPRINPLLCAEPRHALQTGRGIKSGLPLYEYRKRITGSLESLMTCFNEPRQGPDIRSNSISRRTVLFPVVSIIGLACGIVGFPSPKIKNFIGPSDVQIFWPQPYNSRKYGMLNVPQMVYRLCSKAQESANHLPYAIDEFAHGPATKDSTFNVSLGMLNLNLAEWISCAF
nr:hypothetical protein Iba_chr03dCG6340 [Ipomoea batatas]